MKSKKDREKLKDGIVRGLNSFSTKLKMSEQESVCSFLVLVGKLSNIEQTGAGTDNTVNAVDRLILALNKCETKNQRVEMIEEFLEIFFHLLSGDNKSAEPHIKALKELYSEI